MRTHTISSASGKILAALLAGASLTAQAQQQQAADVILRNGSVYTADAKDSIQEAVAIRGGRIVYVGSNKAVERYRGGSTQILDMKGHMVIPGLIDGHVHPVWGGGMLLRCNLDYLPLTEAVFLSRIQACLDAEPEATPDTFLQVAGWYRQYMQPTGTEVSRDTLDKLKTRRPIVVVNRDGHSQLANSRALEIAGINDRTPNPSGGSITRDAKGRATGILEDAAGQLVAAKMPPPQPGDALRNLEASVKALNAAGVTSFLDALETPDAIQTFKDLQKQGKLTARAHIAIFANAASAKNADELVSTMVRLRDQYDDKTIDTAPGVRVHTMKFAMDGVIQAPAQTAGLVDPYWVPGADPHDHWHPGTQRGPIYIDQKILADTLVGLAKAGIDPHIHAIGDKAVKLSLDALAAARNVAPTDAFRPAIAHAELVEPQDYARFHQLNVVPVMSYQWSIPGPNSVTGAKNQLGPKRFERMEPFDKLYANDVRVVYGSDWPVDRMNYWLALKGGITRAGGRDIPAQFAGRLNAQPGLSRTAALRSITINGAWALHQEKDTGSIEVGKLADIVVLKNDFLKVADEDLAENAALLTMVGGRIVHDDGTLGQKR